MSRGRFVVVVFVVLVWFGGVAWRLYELQIRGHDSYLERARRQQSTIVKLEAPRGTIFDARGRELAVSVKSESLFVDPSMIEDVEEVARALASVLDVEVRRLVERIEKGREFVWIERKLGEAKAAAIRELGLEGVSFVEESRRSYPHGQLAAHVLGFVGTDHRGLAGLEFSYDDLIAGKTVPRSVLRDGIHARVITPASLGETAVAGADLHLTLDSSLQYLAETELERAIDEHGAVAGTVIMLDARDSAILAMASYPTFDPNEFARSTADAWRNRAVMDAYEPGSTFKMVTAAAAIDSLAVHADDRFDCEMGGFTVHRTYIRDHKPFGVLSFREIIAKSSNVGVIKAALLTGPERLHQVTDAFGLGRPTRVDLPGESAGIVRSVESWNELATAYASFGHGLSVTPLQLANAYVALANGGQLNAPYIVAGLGRGGEVEPVEPPPPLRVDLSPSTFVTVVRMLEGVVEEGTGTAARVEGFRVAGKTGTAEKSDQSGYSETARVASFLGMVPSRRPRIVCLVSIDEPSGVTGGGVVAAPVFSAIVEQALLYLGVPPEVEEWEDRTHFVSLPPAPGLPRPEGLAPNPKSSPSPPRVAELSVVASRTGGG